MVSAALLINQQFAQPPEADQEEETCHRPCFDDNNRNKAYCHCQIVIGNLVKPAGV